MCEKRLYASRCCCRQLCCVHVRRLLLQEAALSIGRDKGEVGELAPIQLLTQLLLLPLILVAAHRSPSRTRRVYSVESLRVELMVDPIRLHWRVGLRLSCVVVV